MCILAFIGDPIIGELIDCCTMKKSSYLVFYNGFLLLFVLVYMFVIFDLFMVELYILVAYYFFKVLDLALDTFNYENLSDFSTCLLIGYCYFYIGSFCFCFICYADTGRYGYLTAFTSELDVNGLDYF